MKKIIAIPLLIVVVFSFASCCLFYDYECNATDNFDIGYSKLLNQAFLSDYNWDGTEKGMNIVIPEEYKKIPVTAFGGYFGRGVPCSFGILLTDEAKELLSPNATGWYFTSNISTHENYEIKYLNFNVHISSNISEMEGLWLDRYIVAKHKNDTSTSYEIYVPLCNVTCDEDNKTFYAKDGKLYFKGNDQLVTDIMYEDFDVGKDIESKKDKIVSCHPF
ncbi:MAG: hypothetical protein E7612_03920 [Ruminococcaceae bacterium]|nr:hypothetical protein [Oscillospiraceae bacterium]